MCIHVNFMSTQNVTGNVHYLPLFSASLALSLVLSVEDFLLVYLLVCYKYKVFIASMLLNCMLQV